MAHYSDRVSTGEFGRPKFQMTGRLDEGSLDDLMPLGSCMCRSSLGGWHFRLDGGSRRDLVSGLLDARGSRSARGLSSRPLWWRDCVQGCYRPFWAAFAGEAG